MMSRKANVQQAVGLHASVAHRPRCSETPARRARLNDRPMGRQEHETRKWIRCLSPRCNPFHASPSVRGTGTREDHE